MVQLRVIEGGRSPRLWERHIREGLGLRPHEPIENALDAPVSAWLDIWATWRRQPHPQPDLRLVGEKEPDPDAGG